MHKPGGVLIRYDVTGEHHCDTFTCRHCPRVVIVPPGAHPDQFGDFCRSCMAPICLRCASKPCDHFEKKLERSEAAGRMLADMGLA
jgi:hypothetical protein